MANAKCKWTKHSAHGAWHMHAVHTCTNSRIEWCVCIYIYIYIYIYTYIHTYIHIVDEWAASTEASICHESHKRWPVLHTHVCVLQYDVLAERERSSCPTWTNSLAPCRNLRVCACVYLRVCIVCVCMCVCERERERERAWNACARFLKFCGIFCEKWMSVYWSDVMKGKTLGMVPLL